MFAGGLLLVFLAVVGARYLERRSSQQGHVWSNGERLALYGLAVTIVMGPYGVVGPAMLKDGGERNDEPGGATLTTLPPPTTVPLVSTVSTGRTSQPTTSIPPSSRLPPAIVDRFDVDAQGWKAILGADVEYRSMGGNPGGYVSATDIPGLQMTWYWEAPARYQGDRSAYSGRTLTFDLKQSLSSEDFDAADVSLLGGGLELVFDLPNSPGKDWTSYTVPLDGGNRWHTIERRVSRPATIDDMRVVLTSLTYLRIRGEYALNVDTGGLDNVIFGS